MTEFRLQGCLAASAAAVMALTLTACESEGPDASNPPTEAEHFELDLSGREECEAAGHLELIDFFAANDIEVIDEDFKEEFPSFCSISMIWSATSDGEHEFDGGVIYGLKVFDSVFAAESALEQPSRLGLTSSSRSDEDLEAQVEGDWDAGFVWSRPDSWGAGPTDVAARTANIVVYASFKYDIPGSMECDGDGCAVMPSELVEWIQSEYLPAVASRLDDLIQQ